eukprot:scaffold2641_cov110-Skeletonema_dohrnii-CCMP3373.AAC.9
MAAVCLVLLYHKLFFCHCWLFGGGRSPLPQNLGNNIESDTSSALQRQVSSQKRLTAIAAHRSSTRSQLETL